MFKFCIKTKWNVHTGNNSVYLLGDCSKLSFEFRFVLQTHPSECGDNASPVKRFFSKMKVKIGSLMNNSPLSKSPSDVAQSPKSVFSGGSTAGLQKSDSVCCSDRENGLLLEKGGYSSTSLMNGMGNSSKEFTAIGLVVCG